MTDSPIDPKTTVNEEISVLTEEYKILQDKIDKIGAFRVTIKGWSVTATVAALVAVTADRGFAPWVSAIALDFLLLWFFLFERQQVQLGWKFNGRVRSIEIQIDRRRHAAGAKTAFSSPNIARSLFGGKKRRELIAHVFPNPSIERRRKWVNDQARLARASDLLFYATLCFATWAIIWIDHPQKPTPPIVVQNTINVPAPIAPDQEPPAASPPAQVQTKAPTRGGK